MLAVAGGVSGCAIRLPSFGQSDPAPTSQMRPPPSGTIPRSPVPSGNPQPQTGPPLPALTRTQPKPGNAISSTFKKAAQSVGDALTIKPKVVRAVDPTSLASDPGPIGPDLYVSAAQMTENRGDFEAARRHYEKALDIQKDCLPALIGLSRLHHRSGNLALASQYSRRAV